MSSPRLLASTGPLFGRPLTWACGVIRAAGYDGVELMVTRDPATQDPEQIARASEAEGIPIPVVHGPFLLLTRHVFGTDLVLKARRSLKLAAQVGADLMVVHPPLRWQRSFDTWLRQDADAQATELGTRIGIENMYPIHIVGRRLRLHRYTRPEHLTGFRHVVFDTSHFGVADVDINAAYERLRPAVTHMHLSDHRGGGRDSHAPIGHGNLALARLLGRAGEDEQFPDSITVEVDCRGYVGDRAGLIGHLQREREKCQALLDGEPAQEFPGPRRAPRPRG